MQLRLILFGTASLVISFFASLTVMNLVWPQDEAASVKPALTAPPPLPAATRKSIVVAPISIAISAIRDTVDRAAPRNFTGNADNPAKQLIQDAVINWTAARGPITAAGANNTLSISTPLSGTVHVGGVLTQQAGGAVNGLVNNLLGGDTAKKLGNVGINVKNLNANADLRGLVIVAAKPALLSNWRVEPNLAAQVSLADTNVATSGVRLNVANQLRPVIDHMVSEQVATMTQRVRSNPIIEQNARAQWTKMCRSMPLQAPGSGLPELWIELRPLKLSAMQPKIDAGNVQLVLAIEGETRITATETKPVCPFPNGLDIVPSLEAGRVDIGVPIDLPFTEVNTIVDSQIKGHTFPDDGKSAVAITVKSASVEPAGDRLLISLLVNAQEKRSFFGFGGDATVHVYGKPVLDQAEQVLRLTDIQLAVESEAAFGLLGAAARAAMPYLQRALADKAKVDLKPFAANARDKIAAAMGEFRKSEDGVTVDTAVTGLRLTDIAFDSKTLRVIAEADGTVSVAVKQLPAL
jgi:hypothetical protein